MQPLNRAILAWPRTAKQLAVGTFDSLLALLAMWLAFTLRFDTLHWPQGGQWWVYLLGPLLAVAVFVSLGLYDAIFRYNGLAAMATTAKAVTLYSALLLLALVGLQALGFAAIPRSLGILQPLIFFLLIAAGRATARAWLGRPRDGRRAGGRLLIYGAGSAGVQTAAAIANANQFALLGFVDDDPGKTGRSINGKPVYTPDQTPEVIRRFGVTDILLAVPSASRERRNQIVDSLRSLPVHVRTLPGLADLASGRVTVQDFHELDIEDLLGRAPVPPQRALLARNLTGKTVLVTGAGGSIGSELCRQIIQESPHQLVLLDHSEFALYRVQQELLALTAQQGLNISIAALLGSVCDSERVSDIFNRYRPDTVYHAAAYKHVPLVEFNPVEGILNNVLGTLHVAQAGLYAGVANLVLISTDKAVRPTNVMGASKRLAEMVLQALAAQDPGDVHTCFAMVRFGNVLGSSGSVVPLFRQQLATGGPLTVTHTEVTRYFMTIPEAAQLVLQAGAMATGGEVFVLDMGQPVRILELAQRMITLSGMRVRDDAHADGDIEIAITGLRPGEKLYEELLTGDNPQPTVHPRIMQAREGFVPWDSLSASLSELTLALKRNDVPQALNILQRLVPEATLQATPVSGPADA